MFCSLFVSGDCLLSRFRSTIGATGLNFSVRNGKRWIPRAVIALMSSFYRHFSLYDVMLKKVHIPESLSRVTFNLYNSRFFWHCCPRKGFGRLVLLGFGVTAFTPAAYQRHSLWRPSRRSYLGEGFVLRCFQHLSWPEADTRRCTWRHNRQTGALSITVLSY